MLRCAVLVSYVCLLAYVVLLCCPHLAAQTTNATINGQITDPQGRIVPGVDVQAVNIDTNTSFSSKTNDSGIYAIPNIAPGRYRLAVRRDGFKGIDKTDLVLHVQDILQQNFALEVGSTSESITVTGEAVNINTTDASVGTVVDRHFVENLPLNGRSFQALFNLTPGVVVTPTTYTSQGQFSVNGQRPDANYFTVDGASANSGSAGGATLVQTAGGSMPILTALGGTQSLVSVDAMQEFRIQTSSFAPEFGRTPGAQVSIATRSGTNQFHGTLFDYFRNEALDANTWFGNQNRLPKPPERQNDFGGVLGGPIVRDRTFFFFSYEGLRLSMPTTATGVVLSTSGRAATPPSLQFLLSLFPLPNGPDLGNGVAQFSSSYANPSSLNAYSFRLDHTINSKTTIFGRYSDTPSSLTQRQAVPTSLSNSEVRSRTMTIGVNQTLRPDMANEARANYSNVRAGTVFSLDAFGGATPPSLASLLKNFNFPSGQDTSNSYLNLTVLNPRVSIGAGLNSLDEQRQLNFVDNFSFSTAHHTLKTGVDYRWLSPINAPRPYDQQAYFSGIFGGTGTLQSGVAQTLYVDSYNHETLLVQNLSLYAQDTWKIDSRLTLTYGLRWDLNPPERSKDDAHPLLVVRGLDNPATAALAPPGTSLYSTTYRNIAPRIGAAYTLKQTAGWEAVLRAGVGLFYDLGSTANLGIIGTWPINANKTVTNVTLPASALQAAPAPPSNTPVPQASTYATIPNLEVPKTLQWNVAVEQSLGGNQTLSLTYVGASGRNLLRNTSLYAPNPNFTSLVVVAGNTGKSNYNALQIKYERHLSHGLQVLGFYAWSHSIDNSSDGASISTPSTNPNIDKGSSNFDIRHSLNGALIYNLPAPTQPGIWRAIVGGWSLNDSFLAHSASPVDVLAATVLSNGAYYTPRANVVMNQPVYLYGSQYPGGKVLNKAAFINPSSGMQGNLGRNALRGFDAWQMDCALRRQFPLTERVHLQFSIEFFNIFNHANFGPPINSISNALFGQSTQILAASLGTGGLNGGFNPLYQIGGQRSGQLALKLQF